MLNIVAWDDTVLMDAAVAGQHITTSLNRSQHGVERLDERFMKGVRIPIWTARARVTVWQAPSCINPSVYSSTSPSLQAQASALKSFDASLTNGLADHEDRLPSLLFSTT